MIDWVDSALVRWAEYYRDGRDYGLGYPSCSVEARVFQGGAGSRLTADVPEQVAFIESAVLSMDINMRLTVRVAYMSSCERGDQARYLSKQLKARISRQRLAEMIHQAHRYIEGYARGAGVRLKNT